MSDAEKIIDKTGRIVLPKLIRKYMGVENGDMVSFVLEENGNVILKRLENKCAFCGEIDDLKEFNGKHICKECHSGIKKLKF